MDLKGRNFLTLKDFSPEEITGLLDLAADLKEKKKKVRSAFVDIVNSLPTVNGQLTRASYADEDFNIDNRRQIIGIVTFDVMAVLSVILAVRIV